MGPFGPSRHLFGPASWTGAATTHRDRGRARQTLARSTVNAPAGLSPVVEDLAGLSWATRLAQPGCAGPKSESHPAKPQQALQMPDQCVPVGHRRHRQSLPTGDRHRRSSAA